MRKKAGSEELSYHELIRKIPTEYIDSTLWERPETVVIGQFSHNSRGKKDPAEMEQVMEQGSPEISCKADLSKCMNEVWQTSALVNLDYSRLKDIYSDLQGQVEMELRFNEPKEFYRQPIRDRIKESEALLEDEQQGFSRLLKSLNIIETLIEFLEDYAKEFNKLVQSKSYTNIVELLIDVLEQEWGKNLYQYLENKNIHL
jgi:molecular chaperone DnaK (HSP70)